MSPYSISIISGLRQSTRRAVGLLTDSTDASIDAATQFTALEPKHDRTVRSRMDYWIDFGHKDEWFHGWPQSLAYKECFVFKWDEKKVHRRLYGFLCHPLRRSPAFQLCVLCYHDIKSRADTDFAILDRINGLRTAAGVVNELRRLFSN